MQQLPIHFFTLVLNGEPFIRYHLERFKALNCPWHWHIIEGLAELKHDTAWSVPNGAQVPADVVRDGRSVDGTAEYLDQIARENPDRITIYRAPGGRMWEGKLEMVNAPLANVPDDSLLWEIDSDELWTTDQFQRMRELFLQQPSRTAAIFYCWYFVAPTLAINRRRRYPELEWRRAWRFRKGMKWLAHEPPVLGLPVAGSNKFNDVTLMQPFTPQETERAGLVFQHFAYVIEPHLRFKEKYYGYKGITEQWHRLQAQKDFPVPLKQYFNWPWVHPQAMVDPLDYCGILPLAHIDSSGQWVMHPPTPPWAGAAPDDLEFEKDRYTSNWKLGYHLLPRVLARYGCKVGAEVGVAAAGHSNAILQRTAVERLYGIDSYHHRPGYQDLMNLPQKRFDQLHDNVLRFMARHGERFKMIRADSAVGARQITEPLDFVYIDAEHSYEGVKKDLSTWYDKVKEGGIVAGHDYNHPNFPGVSKAIHEFMDPKGLRVHVEDEFFWWVHKVMPKPVVVVPPGGQGTRAQRGVLFLQWGNIDALLQRATRAVQMNHPELPIHVQQMPDGATVLDKAMMFALSPFDETLYLDADTIVLDRLDFGFAMAARHGIACTIGDCPWARRYAGLAARGDLVDYDTGVIFFTRQAKPVFDAWQIDVKSVDSSYRLLSAQNQSLQVAMKDQAGFSAALAQCPHPPFVLPMNWNFRPRTQRSWWGPIKVWHDKADPPASLANITQEQAREESIIRYLKFNN